MQQLENTRVAIVGLGYVGLPLAVEFGRRYDTVGFDIRAARVDELRAGHDHTLEVDAAELAAATRLRFSAELEGIRGCNVYIVTVPTPIDAAKRPDLTPLVKASESLGQVLERGDIVVYESTVYPGCTEEVCIPILERVSGLVFNRDFFAGYSPERINPGDKQHRVTSILKVTSGSTPEVADFVNRLYGSIITAGTHQASCIKVAEAAKVIENTQRDVNIGLVNELAVLFGRLGIDTEEVLDAAGSKWNFLPFRPGLVGGHCIGVDPYYLTHKAELSGYHPEVILAGRRINDGMGPYVARQTVKHMIHQGRNVLGAKVNVLGLTFKENCKDIRNSKVIDVIRELEAFGCECYVHDPEADPDETLHEYGIRLRSWDELPAADATILAVSHKQFVEKTPAQIMEKTVKRGCFVQVKASFPNEAFTREGVRVWRL